MTKASPWPPVIPVSTANPMHTMTRPAPMARCGDRRLAAAGAIVAPRR